VQLLNGGGYVLDGWGGVHAFGGAPPLRAAAYHTGSDTARGLTLQRDGRGGYVVDRNGRLTPYGSPASLPACALIAPGSAPTRGVWMDPAWPSSALFTGATVDGWGGIHALCGSRLPDTARAPAWKGWDIARGIAFTQSGGFVLDAWGGIHAFGNARVTSSSGYWKGWDIARGIAVGGNGTGVVIDGWGGLHTFTYTT
jgi:hypothetical protein